MTWGLLAQFKALWAPKPKDKPTHVAMGVVSAGLAPEAPVLNIAGVVAEAPRRQAAELGMQGHAPIVAVTKYRHGTRCKCGEVVLRKVRHICIYNAEHHLASLTDAERAGLIRQLETLGTKVIPFKPRAKRKRA